MAGMAGMGQSSIRAGELRKPSSLGQRENLQPLILSFGGRKLRDEDTCQLASDILLASENSSIQQDVTQQHT